MDCDEQHEPARIPDFVRAIQTGRWDIVSGSRYLGPDDENDAAPTDRRAVNVKITRLVNDTFGWQLTDTFCGFKAHRVEAMRQLHLTETGYAFPLQLWPRAFRADLRISEIPVRRIYHDLSRTFGPVLNDPGQAAAALLGRVRDRADPPVAGGRNRDLSARASAAVDPHPHAGRRRRPIRRTGRPRAGGRADCSSGRRRSSCWPTRHGQCRRLVWPRPTSAGCRTSPVSELRREHVGRWLGHPDGQPIRRHRAPNRAVPPRRVG